MFGNREQINRKQAEEIIRNFKSEKVDTAISYDGFLKCVEIHKMEKDSILNERLPVYTYIIFCRDGQSARRFSEKLINIRWSF